jgi:hypothetical protein
MVDSLVESSSSRLEGDDKWWRATLSIFSVTLTPQEISERLGLQPTRTHKQGQPRGFRRKDGSTSPSVVWKDSAWLLTSPLKPDRNLMEHVRWLLEKIEPKADIIKALSSDCTGIRFFCGFSSGNGQGGFVLEADTLSRISRLGLNIVLDLYPPSDPDISYDSESEQQVLGNP